MKAITSYHYNIGNFRRVKNELERRKVVTKNVETKEKLP